MAPAADHKRQTDDAFRAIGRYVVAFSELVSEMRWLVARYIAPRGSARLAEIALGEASAAQVSHVFFGLCRDAADFTAAELEIESQLRREIDEEIIPTRNDIAHGDWMVGAQKLAWGGIAADVIPPRLTRLIPHQKAGPVRVRHLTVEELDATSERLVEVTTMVVEFAKLALGLAVVRKWPDGGGAISRSEFRVQDIYEIPGSTRSRGVSPRAKGERKSSKRAQVRRTFRAQTR